MSEPREYYVYALKDPRHSPAQPFYIGKGVGSRMFDHLKADDESEKSKRVREIQDEGFDVVVSKLVDKLTEKQALILEAELIAAFGTADTGGMLLNKVLPSGLGKKSTPGLNIPSGVKEKAQIGLNLIKEAVLELAQANPKGITNSETASALGLRSDYGGGSKDYLSYSILGVLMREGKIQRVPKTRRHVSTVK